MKNKINSKYRYMFVIPYCWIALNGEKDFEKFIQSEFKIRAKIVDNIRVIDMWNEAGELISHNCHDAIILVHTDDMVRALNVTRFDKRIQKFEIFLAKGNRWRYPHSVLEKYWAHFPEYLTWLTHFPPKQNVMPEILTILETLHTDMNTDVFINGIRKINNSYTWEIYLVDDYPDTDAGKFNHVFVMRDNESPVSDTFLFENYHLRGFGLRTKFLENILVNTENGVVYDLMYSIHDDDLERSQEFKGQFRPFEFHIILNNRGLYSDEVFEKYFQMNDHFKHWVKSFPPDVCLKDKMCEILDEAGTTAVGEEFYEELRKINIARYGSVANA